MADSKITALDNLTSADPANDMIPIVDVSATPPASGNTKRISINNLLACSPSATLASATITGAATVGTTLGVTGVSTFAAGTALLPALTTTGDTNTGIYYPAADTFAVTTGGTERYRVDSSGNVGIGVTPTNLTGQTRVEIKGSAIGNLTLRTSSGSAAARDWQIACNLDAFGELNFRQGASQGAEPNSGTTRMVLDASGSLLLGTTSSTIGATAARLHLSADGTDRWAVGPQIHSQNFIIQALNIYGVYLAGLTATSWSSASDERMKDIIEPISNAVAKVGQLRSVIGKFKSDETNTRRSFLIAQDVQAVLPEAVDASNPNRLGVAYTEVIPLLVAAIKELTARLQTLEAR